MTQQTIEDVEEAKKIAVDKILTQVEAVIAIHVHICHLIIAEAHHTVYGDPFQISSEMFLEELADLKNTLDYTLDSLPRLTANSVRTSMHRRGQPVPARPKQGKQLLLEKIVDKFRKRHANLAFEHLQSLSALVQSSVRRLSEASFQRPSGNSATNSGHHRQQKARSVPGGILDPSPSAPAILDPNKRKRRERDKSHVGFGGKVRRSLAPVVSDSGVNSGEVSFNLELLDMELLGADDAHPLSSAFTTELFRYEALFEQRLVDFSELQRLLMVEIKREVLSKVKISTRDVAGDQADDRALLLWKKSLEAINNMEEDFIESFFSSIGRVTFPKLVRARRDTSFPRELRSPGMSDESEDDHNNGRHSPSDQLAKPEDYEVPLQPIMQRIRATRPHMELILHSYVEFMIRNQQEFLDMAAAKMCINCFRNRRVHNRLKKSDEFNDRLNKAKLDTEYLTRAYKEAMNTYCVQLGMLVTAHARNFAKSCKHNPNAICDECKSHICLPPADGSRPVSVRGACNFAVAESMQKLTRVTEPPPKKISVIPAEPVNAVRKGRHRRLTSIMITFTD